MKEKDKLRRERGGTAVRGVLVDCQCRSLICTDSDYTHNYNNEGDGQIILSIEGKRRST